jgi:hypothetical protein
MAAPIPKWKQDMLAKKQKEEEESKQQELDKQRGQWMDNLVGEAEPSWMKALKAQKSQPPSTASAAPPEPSGPGWKRDLQEKKASTGGSSAPKREEKPMVRLY